MKPSEITGGKAAEARSDPLEHPNPYRCSSLAIPPITPQEARDAQHSICCVHDGLVRQTGDVEGRVFFCPSGSEYWRYTRNPPNAGMYGPLSYPNDSAV